MRAVIAVALVLAMTVAGCGGKGGRPGNDADGDGDGAGEGGPTSTSGPGGNGTGVQGPMDPQANATGAPTLQLSDCTNFGGVFPVPMADAAAALPAGFEPVASPNDPAGGATLYILFLDCAGSAVDGNATGPVNVAYAELAVVPPAEYTLPGISDYTVPLAIGAGNQAVGDRLAEFMLGHAGQSTVTDVTDASPGPRRARVVVDGVTLDLTGQFAGEAGTLRDGGFALIGVQDGAVKTVIQAFSLGGSASEGTVTQQSSGLPVLAQARPVARGFTVSGFTLTFTLAQTVASEAAA